MATFSGSGEALIISKKCNKKVPFTSTYKLTGDSINRLWKLEYNNSFIGSRTLSSVYNSTLGSRFASDGLLNFISTEYYDDITKNTYRITTISGLYKKCNYSSIELDRRELTDKSAKEFLKDNSASSEEFHKMLDLYPIIKKKYLENK
jgi:hypothetical protein